MLLMFFRALVLAVFERKRMGARLSLPLWGATTAMAAFILVSMVAQINGRTYPGYEVVFEAESPYGWVRVVDQPAQDIRWLMSGGSTIGAEQLSSGLSVLGYQRSEEHTSELQSR